MNPSPNTIVIDLDSRVYRLSAIKKAAYRLGDRCFVQIDAESGSRITVTLTPKGGADGASLAGQFQNEVLDQELREVVAQETDGIRNLILAQAFSQTSLLDPVGEQADAQADPLGIRAPEQH